VFSTAHVKAIEKNAHCILPFFVGKTNADVSVSLFDLFGSRAVTQNGKQNDGRFLQDIFSGNPQ